MHGIGGQPDWTSEDPQSGSPPSEGKPPLFILGILVPLVLMVVTQLGQALLALGGGGYILALLLASIQFVSPLFSVGLAGILIWMSLDRATATRTSLGEPFEILEARYLDGELDIEEYERRLDRLFDHDVPDAPQPVDAVACQYARGEVDDSDLTTRLESARTESQSEPTIEETAVSAQQDRKSAVAHLRYRYAEGDLTEAEYKRRLAVLRETERERS
ncbi:SHOCT domain-containing protein [Halovenus salina]|uniref:SHOCT domain-containing protein n=1 Tax=Halovenus salina TaxID=1510225 RepID=UPI002260829C|nr:SHOCT domain-containing protein [Halovenus salina]